MNKALAALILLLFLTGCGLTSKDTKPGGNTTEKLKVYTASGKGLAFSVDSGISWQHYAKARNNGLADEHFDAILIVDDKNFWAGTGKGLAMTTNNAETWTMYTSDDVLGGNEVRTIMKNGDKLYIGTNGGLSISTDNARSWQTLGVDDGLAANGINAILVNGKNVFLGTDQGLSISTDNARTWMSFPVTAGAGINSFFQKNDKLYMATSRGLYVTFIGATANLGVIEKITADGQADLLNKNINFFFIDSEGNWWLGTNEGLARSNNKGLGWRRYDQADGIDAYTINDIAVKGLMVFLATDKGLSVSNDGGDSWVTYNKDEGLLSLTLRRVVVP
jgi:ligand-binding sensor domain-containing protein